MPVTTRGPSCPALLVLAIAMVGAMVGGAASAGSCPSGTYTQLYTRRYVPPALSATAPPAWPRLQGPVELAVHAGPSAAWLQTNRSVLCCPAVTDLTTCAVIRSSAAGARVRRI